MSGARNEAVRGDGAKGLPAWASTLAEKYKGGTVWEFILNGNVSDFVPFRSQDGAVQFHTLKSFLAKVLFPQRDAVLFYDLASGISFAEPSQMSTFLDVVKAVDTATNSTFSTGLPRDPRRALWLIERYLLSGLMERKDRRRVAVVIDFAQLVAPAESVASMSQDEAAAVITLLKWAQEPLFQTGDITIVLIVENLADLNDMLVKSPHTAKLDLPLPGEAERLEYIQNALVEPRGDGVRVAGRFKELSQLTPEQLARLTAGLSRINLLHVVGQAINNGRPLTMEYVRTTKKELIEKECYGLLDFVEPKYGLDMVVGQVAAKRCLEEDARLVAQGKSDALPMGYLLCGPIGTGKTFLATCYTGSIGIPCVTLRNFRSQWQGVTEGNWEKILTVLKATGPVGVIIDEADAAVGNRDQGGDSGTSSRVFAKLASTMGDTSNRGFILWFLLTCRPDLLPVDLKRQGRCEVHIPLFYPETPEERVTMAQSMAKKTKTPFAADALTVDLATARLSGADIEAVLVRAKRRAYLDDRATVEARDVAREVQDFMPAIHGAEIELQELAAVLECTNREFLPAAWRDADRRELRRRFDDLKALVG